MADAAFSDRGQVLNFGWREAALLVLFVVLLWMILVIYGHATTTVKTDTEPFFMVKDTLRTDEGSFVVMQAVAPVAFVLKVDSSDRQPLKGEAMKCKVERHGEDFGDKTVYTLNLNCPHLIGDINTVIFPPR